MARPIRKFKWIPDTTPDQPVCQVAVQAISGRIQVVQHYLPLAALHNEADVENVHQLRVATRRAMAALDVFVETVPRKRTRWIRKQLRKIRRAAGVARDIDVFSAWIAGLDDQQFGDAKQWCTNRASLDRKKAQYPIVDIYDSPAGAKIARRLPKLLRKVRWRGETFNQCEPVLKELASEVLIERVNALENGYRSGLDDIESFHEFRIKVKQLRYAMELLAGAYKGSFRSQLYSQVEQLQTPLGMLNDQAAFRARLESWLKQESAVTNPAVCEQLRQLWHESSESICNGQAKFRSEMDQGRLTSLVNGFDEYVTDAFRAGA